MRLSMTQENLVVYVATQVDKFFPDGNISRAPLNQNVNETLERVENCFNHIKVKNYHNGHEVLFNHLHSDQYATFLYFLSNTIWQKTSDAQLASKFYLLNKVLHSIELFYEIMLPDIFLLAHPVGSILGHANYSDYLVVFQHCTVGTNIEFKHPTLDKGIVLFGGSTILGDSHIGSNTWIQIGTRIMDKDVPNNQIVFGVHPNVSHKATTRSVFEQYFRNHNIPSFVQGFNDYENH